LKDAQIFEEDDPKFLSAMDSGKYRAWEKKYIDRMATLHVDSEKLGFGMAYKIDAEHPPPVPQCDEPENKQPVENWEYMNWRNQRGV